MRDGAFSPTAPGPSRSWKRTSPGSRPSVLGVARPPVEARVAFKWAPACSPPKASGGPPLRAPPAHPKPTTTISRKANRILVNWIREAPLPRGRNSLALDADHRLEARDLLRETGTIGRVHDIADVFVRTRRLLGDASHTH
jgi:hypothetical protein